MPENKSQEEIEFYSASVSAWYNSSLEHDKSLLTLSAGGIGLLITLLTTGGLNNSYMTLTLYVLAILAFIVCLISVLLIFNGNKTHIVKLFQGEDVLNDDYLEKLDKIAIWSFIIAVVFASIVGVATAYKQVKKEINMTDKTIKTTSGIAQDSFKGAQMLQKSFTGAQQLKPQATSSGSSTSAVSSNSTQQQPTTSNTPQPAALQQPASPKK
jgi:hypothetical protein